MSETDLSESIPNSDESAFVGENSTECESAVTIGVPAGIKNNQNNVIAAEHVYVTTSQGLLAAKTFHNSGLKTTHIVIHDQSIAQLENDLKIPASLTTQNTSFAFNKDKGFRYPWDDSVYSNVLPVRCKNTNGELYKAKFGSGNNLQLYDYILFLCSAILYLYCWHLLPNK